MKVTKLPLFTVVAISDVHYSAKSQCLDWLHFIKWWFNFPFIDRKEKRKIHGCPICEAARTSTAAMGCKKKKSTVLYGVVTKTQKLV